MRFDRQPIYDALDKIPDSVFSALCYAMYGVNRVLGLVVLDDPTSSDNLDEAMKPFITKIK